MLYASTVIQKLPSRMEMQRASNRRDASYDGIFYICVRTTGIFCRPSCPSRKAKERNIIYHTTVRDCLLGSFRPCKRCRPLAVTPDDARWLDPLLAHLEKFPGDRVKDSDLAAMTVSPYRVRRYFKRNFAMTFQAYHRARRMGVALRELQSGKDPLAVGLDQSYESTSGFRDAFKRVFGTVPSRSENLRIIHTQRIDTPIGPLVAGATDDGLCLLEFADRRAFQKQMDVLRRRFRAALVPGRHRYLDLLQRELAVYFAGRRTTFTLPLDAPGTEFQKEVWSALREIPCGQTWSYAQLARHIGRTGAQRAVGRANGDNRIAILIPCHRVVKDDGTLCGYGGGLWRKQFLLDLERRNMGCAELDVLARKAQ